MINIELDTSSTKTQTIAFLLLFVVFFVYVAIHVNDFYVPESDFFDFREKAIQIRNFEWPENSKRPPLYSALVALVSAPIPGKNRELYAAEIISALSALLSLLLVYRISKQFLGKYAFLVAWIWALHPTTLRMAVKPKSEIFVTVLILWAFDRFFRGDRRAYLLGFFATLVRYEGALTILAFTASDLLFVKEKTKTIIFAVLSGSFIVIWTLLQIGGSEGVSYGNYFSDYQLNFSYIKTFWVVIIGFLPIRLFKLWALFGSILMMVGCILCFKKNRHVCLAIVTFLFGFIVMHIIWPMSNIDYPIIVSWCVFLLFALGVHALGLYWGFSVNFKKKLTQKYWMLLSVIFFIIIGGILVNIKFLHSQQNVNWGIIVIFILALAYYFFKSLNNSPNTRITIMGFLLGLFLIFAFFLNSKANSDFYDVRYAKAEFRLVGEWYDKHHQDGDRLVVDQPTIVAYYTSLNLEKDFIRLVDVPQADGEQLHKWFKSHQTTYVTWLSNNRVFEEGDKWYVWKRDNRGWKNIAFLKNGINISGYEVINEIRCGPRWAYIYKVL